MLETLERRWLLTGGPEPNLGVPAGPPDLGGSDDHTTILSGRSVPGKGSRLSADLLELLDELKKSADAEGPTDAAETESDSEDRGDLLRDVDDSRVGIRISGLINNLQPALLRLGFDVLGSAPDRNLIEGFIPIATLPLLEPLADLGLLGVLPLYKPLTDAGLVTSQGDVVHEADRVRAALPTGFDGAGVRIGIMSDSFDVKNGAADDVDNGDLPAGVSVRQDLSFSGSDEGRALAQLIHDVAPGASLSFSSAFFGEANFAQQIRDLAVIENADILIDDVVYLREPFFQDGIIAQAIDEVVSEHDVVYFSSAGNRARRAFDTTDIQFAGDTGMDAILETDTPSTYYDFDTSAGVDTRQQITLPAGAQFRPSMQWDDPYYTLNGVDTDLDIFLVDPIDDTIVASSVDDNLFNQTPSELLSFTNTTGAEKSYDVVIHKFTGPDPGRIKYVDFGRSTLISEYPLDSPTVNPHAAAVGANAVAAVPYFDQGTPENFTSQGPSTILFEPDGTPKTIEVRETPDFAATDGTDTTFFPTTSPTADFDGSGFPNFFGTSAAAPHAAAIAALVRQANPGFNADEVRYQLASTAIDIGVTGFDNVTGAGLLNAYDAIFSPVVAAPLPVIEDFEDGDLPNAFETRNTGNARILVTADHGPLDTQHLTMDAFFSASHSLTELTLHVDTTGFARVQLSFDFHELGDDDDPMSASFSGSENSDGVALSVDGTNWFKIVELTDAAGNAPDSYTTMGPFDLTALATTHGLTLGSDVRIKFQHYDDRAIPSDGFALDNISVLGDSDPPTDVYLNELVLDPPAPDDNHEYVEIRGPGGQPLTDVYLVFVEGDGDAPATGIGTINHVFDLSAQSLGPGGFLLIREPGNSYVVDAGSTDLVATLDIENGANTAMLVHVGVGGSAPATGQDLDVANDGLDLLPSGWTILDGVSMLDGDTSDRAYADIVFSTNEFGATEAGATFVDTGFGADGIRHVMRIGDSTGSTVGDWAGFYLQETPVPVPPDFRVGATTDPAYDIGGVITNHLGTSNPTSLDITAPSVTIDKASGQADPTNASPVHFTVVFSEPVTGFTSDDVALSGTAGATTAVLTGSGATYNVEVSGMTSDGTVIVEVPAGVAEDAAGNANTASGSTNSVSFDVLVPPTISSLTDNPDPVVEGDDVTLVAQAADSDGEVQSVAFYRDANGDGLPQPGELLGTDLDDSGGWSWTGSTLGFPLGTQTYLAQATDDESLTSTVVSTTGEVNARPATVVGRHIFYNNSAFDGNDAVANANDDNAIAPDPTGASEPILGKTALLPGQTATFQNYTSFSRGINGIMVDILGMPANVSAADFEFRVGNDSSPAGWSLAPAPATVAVRQGAGAEGSDRVTIIWTDNALEKTWLQITVLPTANTGLAAPDVHYWGNAVGDSGNSTSNTHVNATDELNARFNQHNFLDPAPLDDAVDYNRDARVNATDELIARFNQTNFLTALNLISVPDTLAEAATATVGLDGEKGVAANGQEPYERGASRQRQEMKSSHFPMPGNSLGYQVRQLVRSHTPVPPSQSGNGTTFREPTFSTWAEDDPGPEKSV